MISQFQTLNNENDKMKPSMNVPKAAWVSRAVLKNTNHNGKD